jgi:hypothetical protein
MPIRTSTAVTLSATAPGLFQTPDDPALADEQEPVWAGGYKAGRIFSFADLNEFPRFVEDRGESRQIARFSRTDLEQTVQGRRELSWLLRRHLDHHLASFEPLGLVVERRRAFFIGAGDEERAVIYDSAKRRGVRRVMVKRRDYGKRVFHENEAIWYSIERFGDAWCVRLKPTYVFTEADGRTPLPPFMISRLATRRFRFDRNKNVDDDMTFWSRLLGRGRAVVGIGGPGVNNLILSLDYIGFDVPELDMGDYGRSDQDTA